MSEISNKTLLVLALVMILISLGGTWLSLSKIDSISATGRVPAQVDSAPAKEMPADSNATQTAQKAIEANDKLQRT